MLAPVAIDFETWPILPRPDYPPKPVGVAIREPGKRGRYYAWGHPTENNCTQAQAVRALRIAYRSRRPLVFHHAAFDLDVAETHLGIAPPTWDRVHCTQVMAYLWDPNARRIGLKVLAQQHLGMPPDEQEELRDWIHDHVPGARRKRKKWGEYIYLAPGDLVGRYAVGDVDRTLGLLKFFWARVHGMREAYERERRLMLGKLATERHGARLAARRLRKDAKTWEASKFEVDRWICRRLQAPGLNVDSPLQLADAMEDADVVSEWFETPKGGRSLKFIDLHAACLEDPPMFHDMPLVQVLRYRAQLKFALQTFARPWLAQVESGGEERVFFTYNTVTGDKDGAAIGARTGRPSSTPNIQNVPKRNRVIAFGVREERRLKRAGVEVILLPRALRTRVCPLPRVRSYLLPEKEEVWVDVDYAAQELRILAHLAGGQLAELYRQDPRLDLHRYATTFVNAQLGANYTRDIIKNVVFAIIYGAGLLKIGYMIGSTRGEARRIRDAVFAALPGLREFDNAMREAGRNESDPFYTLGGRRYLSEAPQLDAHERTIRTFYYKNTNTIVQGSAADQIKEAWVRGFSKDFAHPLAFSVHDQLTRSVPRGDVAREIVLQREVMESVTLDVPVLADAKVGPKNWSELHAA